MKPEIHPINPPARITCACGNVIETRSTRGSFSVEICSNCHPYYTGKYKLMDTAGRVERFRKKYEAPPAAAKQAAEKASIEKAAAEKAAALKATADKKAKRDAKEAKEKEAKEKEAKAAKPPAEAKEATEPKAQA